MSNNTSDTICALATSTGGAIAVIRLSGSKAISIADSIFSKDIKDAKANTLHYGEIKGDDGETIDDVVVAVYRAPHSYTGEDSVEISCHASRYIVRHILLTLQAHGARQAEPGEYTRRAYLNGKMDLSQAEAVADVIAAANRASHSLAISQLKGHVRTALEALREKLQKLTALLELELDFSDHEDLEFADRTELKGLAHDIGARLTRLVETYRTGKAIKEGIPVAIVGRTNVGKSTLLNRLLGEERAIVSDVPGTTRDSIEDVVDINGVAFRFVDTAGIRQTDDKVEKIGIDRAYKQIEKAAIILWVVDSPAETAVPTSAAAVPLSEAAVSTTSPLPVDILRKKLQHGIPDNSFGGIHGDIFRNKNVIIVHNKADLTPTPLYKDEIAVSAKNGDNIDMLKEKIYEAANIPQLNEGDTIITSARQYGLMREALQNLHRVIDGLESGLSTDLVAEDLRLVIDNLGEITGIARVTTASTLDTIFAHYCIGK